MRRLSSWAIGLLLAPALIAAQPPQPSGAAPAEPGASAERIREAGEALAELDFDRLDTDAEHAARIAALVRLVQAQDGLDARQRYELQTTLILALAGAQRHEEAEAAADALIQLRPSDEHPYLAAVVVANRAGRHARVAAVLDRAARALDVEDRGNLYEFLSPQRVGWDLHALRGPEHRAARAALAEALLRLEWPGPGAPAERADHPRMIVLRHKLDGGDLPAAQRLAAEVKGVSAALSLATDRRFDALNGDADRVARVRAAMAWEDGATAAALAAAPEDVDALARRAAFLRAVGRERDVLDLLLPLMGDPAIVVARGDQGLWLVNEAAYALIGTGAAGEGIELMRPLASMDLEARPDLINTSINFTSILYNNGRTEEALREAERLSAAADGIASDYGKMIVWANAACAAADLGRRAESDAWMRRMEPKAEENRPSLITAHLCRGEADAAERVLLGAFESDTWREPAILWMQEWQPRNRSPGVERTARRFAALAARPAVQAAFARVGHRLRLPLPDTVYGL